MLVTIAKPDFIFENEAGSLKQLVHGGWKQINVITSVANAVRGNHYHKFNQEGFYVIAGSFKLKLRKDDIHEEYTFYAGDMFFIQPNIFHTFEYLEDTTLVSMYSDGVEISETEKDIWTV
jgi:dTDP-4-dehydrorhamnose 3,5-epimerase-like enzyme